MVDAATNRHHPLSMCSDRNVHGETRSVKRTQLAEDKAAAAERRTADRASQVYLPGLRELHLLNQACMEAGSRASRATATSVRHCVHLLQLLVSDSTAGHRSQLL